ncbi:GntR family transcriptional regulator [Aquabacter spiritensis]|uniref:GntR family transcriptional regulator n=1 Tax=Aquabacter spiritensis TaxID=933073 RepID=UPI001A9FD5F1|nr:GntR family transcriptional regulator [Aquabacter spiritensis]
METSRIPVEASRSSAERLSLVLPGADASVEPNHWSFGREGRKPESIFDFVQDITAVTRDKPHQDARLDLEGTCIAVDKSALCNIDIKLMEASVLVSDRGVEEVLRPGEEAPRSVTSAVFVRLRSEVLTGDLKAGQPLRAAAIAERLRVSLTAVREALVRLLSDNFVTSVDQKGFRVSPVSLDDLIDVTETRIQIEGEALRRSMERGGAEWRERIAASHQRLSSIPQRQQDAPDRTNEAWSEAHERFHLTLLDACGSPWLLRFRSTLFVHSERYRRLSVKGREAAARDVAAEHDLIVQAVMAGDVNAATNALAAHYRRTVEIARAVL